MSQHFEQFILIGTKLVTELEHKLSVSLKNLYAGWVSNTRAVTFKVTTKNQSVALPTNNWRSYGSSKKLWVAFKHNEAIKNNVLKEIFELDEYANFKTSELSDSIYEDFIQSNIQTCFDLADEVAIQSNKIDSIKTHLGSGAVIGSIKIGNALLPIALSGHMLLRICNAKLPTVLPNTLSSKLTQRDQVLDKLSSSLEVVAGNVSISFEEFSKMEIGDVIVLDSKVDQPLRSRFSSGLEINVQLCKVKDKTAIQFIE